MPLSMRRVIMHSFLSSYSLSLFLSLFFFFQKERTNVGDKAKFLGLELNSISLCSLWSRMYVGSDIPFFSKK